MTCPTCGCACSSEQREQSQSRYHLDPSTLGRIRALIRCGRSDKAIAAEVGVTHVTVFNIRKRRTWSAS